MNRVPAKMDRWQIHRHFDAVLHLAGYKRAADEAGLTDDSPRPTKSSRTTFRSDSQAREALLDEDIFLVLPEDMVVEILSHRDLLDVIRLRTLRKSIKALIDNRVLRDWSRLLLPWPHENEQQLSMYTFAIGKMKLLREVCFVQTNFSPQLHTHDPFDTYFHKRANDPLETVEELNVFSTVLSRPVDQFDFDPTEVLRCFPNLRVFRANQNFVITSKQISESKLEVIDLMPDDWPVTDAFLHHISKSSSIDLSNYAGEILSDSPDAWTPCPKLRVLRCRNLRNMNIREPRFRQIFPGVTRAILEIDEDDDGTTVTLPDNNMLTDLLIVDRRQALTDHPLHIPPSLMVQLERLGYFANPNLPESRFAYSSLSATAAPNLRMLQVNALTSEDEVFMTFNLTFLETFLQTMALASPRLSRLELYGRFQSTDEYQTEGVLHVRAEFPHVRELRFFIDECALDFMIAPPVAEEKEETVDYMDIDKEENVVVEQRIAFPALESCEWTSQYFSISQTQFPHLQNVFPLVRVNEADVSSCRYWGFPLQHYTLSWLMDGPYMYDITVSWNMQRGNRRRRPVAMLHIARLVILSHAAAFMRMWHGKSRSDALRAEELDLGLAWTMKNKEHSFFSDIYVYNDLEEFLQASDYTTTPVDDFTLLTSDPSGVGDVLLSYWKEEIQKHDIPYTLDAHDRVTPLIRLERKYPQFVEMLAFALCLQVTIYLRVRGLSEATMAESLLQREFALLLTASQLDQLWISGDGSIPFIMRRPMVAPEQTRIVKNFYFSVSQPVQVIWEPGMPPLPFVIEKMTITEPQTSISARLPPLAAFERVYTCTLVLAYEELQTVLQFRGLQSMLKGATLEAFIISIEVEDRPKSDSLRPTVPHGQLPPMLQELKITNGVIPDDYLGDESLPALTSLEFINCRFLGPLRVDTRRFPKLEKFLRIQSA